MCHLPARWVELFPTQPLEMGIPTHARGWTVGTLAATLKVPGQSLQDIYSVWSVAVHNHGLHYKEVLGEYLADTGPHGSGSKVKFANPERMDATL